MRRLLTVSVALTALAVVMSGCQSAAERFRHQLLPLQTQREQEKAQLSATLRQVRLRNSADAQLLSGEIDAMAATDLAISKLSPPDAGRQAFKSYNAATGALVARLREFAQALRAGSNHRLSQAGAAAQDAAGAVTRANDALSASTR